MSIFDWEAFIRKNGKCCACEGSLASSSMINMGQMDRLATWKHPIAGNVLSSDKRPRAVAIVCDTCFDDIAEMGEKGGEKIKLAIEWNPEEKRIVYHKVEDLEKLPPLKPDEESRQRTSSANDD